MKRNDRVRNAPQAEETQMSIADLPVEESAPVVRTSVVETYNEGEYQIEVIAKDGTAEKVDVRVFIGIRNHENNGRAIIICSNNKIYSTLTLKANRVMYDEEINAGKIMAMNTMIKLHSEQIAAMASVQENLLRRLKGSRRLIGQCEYFVLDDHQLKSVHAKDLERCFHFGKKRWLYYSAALESWVLLPKGWQKLTNVERFGLDVAYTDTSILEVGETVGVLDSGKCYQWNGETWDEIAEPIDEPGDEYVVKYMLTYEKSSTGALIYCATGWLYLQ